MAPIIHCVRHAQGYHNLSVANHSMPDPSLTPYGEEQCRQLAKTFPYHDSVDLLVSSPLRRTIYTTLYGFTPEIERGVPIIALPEVQETADVPCDTGTDLAVLKEEMKGKPVDLSALPEGWNNKAGRWAPTAAALEKRAREARQWLKARPEKVIVVVTHGGFLHYFTEDWTGYKESMGTGWANVEYRSFIFADEDGDNATIVETQHSRDSRRGTEKPLTRTERLELRETAMKSRKEIGYQPIQAKRKGNKKDDRDWIGAF
ncbi:hypothetical protein N7G274_002644 [Stereocaulon virgatum]|uniref:Phosphoglycerate mutase-like protein n=1 Tax=Stereocaulon virgatum TaxID=373712 RepID=A0ABR4AJJ8_9LECA